MDSPISPSRSQLDPTRSAATGLAIGYIIAIAISVFFIVFVVPILGCVFYRQRQNRLRSRTAAAQAALANRAPKAHPATVQQQQPPPPNGGYWAPPGQQFYPGAPQQQQQQQQQQPQHPPHPQQAELLGGYYQPYEKEA
jgi:hypothetical protein